MSIEVRSEYGSGKFLFEWDPANDTIDIVQKGMFYRVQLLRKESGGTYRIVDKLPKQTIPKTTEE